MKKYRTYEIETNPDALQEVTPADVIVNDDGETSDNCVTLRQGFVERLLSGQFKDYLKIVQIHKLSGGTKPEIKSIMIPFRELRWAISEMEQRENFGHSFMWKRGDVYLDSRDMLAIQKLTTWPDDITPGEITIANMWYPREIVDKYGNPDMKYVTIDRGFVRYNPSFEKSINGSLTIQQVHPDSETSGRISRTHLAGTQVKRIMEMIKYWEQENTDKEVQ